MINATTYGIQSLLPSEADNLTYLSCLLWDSLLSSEQDELQHYLDLLQNTPRAGVDRFVKAAYEVFYKLCRRDASVRYLFTLMYWKSQQSEGL